MMVVVEPIPLVPITNTIASRNAAGRRGVLVPGILDMLSAQPNTTGSGNADPSRLLQTRSIIAPDGLHGLNVAAPWHAAEAAPHIAHRPSAEHVWASNQLASPPYDDARFRVNLPYAAQPEQLARMPQLVSAIPAIPQCNRSPKASWKLTRTTLPLAQMGQDARFAMQQFGSGRGRQGPMIRYGGQ